MPKRASTEFVAGAETDGVRLKFGGEPYGLPEALWPKSWRSSTPASTDLAGGQRQTRVNVSQLISLGRARLTDRVKGLDAQSMHQIAEGLRLVLSL
ncbi:MAG: hypothetical protein A3K19_24555 [Lentisphaerae bacterium RIFOXYB12_FULL_65_16]|nr:MAG: hypothetical protein A3K18_17400 [Lentisphaerae bacterium RIFOXYA12_64_32]OGV83982.1 MAG: hypothetical protein A3K19_24555 [Lentisphaerae bacterium RIFOXYB12_FULL_65_16]